MQKALCNSRTSVFLSAVCLLAVSCSRPAEESGPTNSADRPPGITLVIRNGSPTEPIDIVAGREYVFDRITLEAEERNLRNSEQALEWLQQESSFRTLDWSGVREARAHWRNYKDTRPAADVFSHVFEGAAWMTEPNALEVSVLDGDSAVMGTPLQLSNQDFLNRLKQWDFDMIKAEFRFEQFAQHKDKDSASVKRAVAKIVFAIQTNMAKRLRIPEGARALRIVWDKKPNEPYVFPIHPIASPLEYGLQIQAELEPEKDLYMPGDTIRAAFTILDGNGEVLRPSDFEANGLTRLYIHLDGPNHDPTFYHEESLNDFRGNRYADHLRAPALGLGTRAASVTTAREAAPLDPSGSRVVVDLHVPDSLPPEAYGTFQISAAAGRVYGSQALELRWTQPIQVGKNEATSFEHFGCADCHVPQSTMDLGLLIPPMVGIEALDVDDFQGCVACHDNSRNGSRRLDKFLHLIHMNRDSFPVAKNNCAVCHLAAESIRKVSFEACSQCHETLHDANRANFTDSQCLGCHVDSTPGHITSGGFEDANLLRPEGPSATYRAGRGTGNLVRTRAQRSGKDG